MAKTTLEVEVECFKSQLQAVRARLKEFGFKEDSRRPTDLGPETVLIYGKLDRTAFYPAQKAQGVVMVRERQKRRMDHYYGGCCTDPNCHKCGE